MGPALVFERLWQEAGCGTVIAELAGKRKHGFALERARVPHGPTDRWRDDCAIADVDGLELHHLYRAMAWLGEELPDKDQYARTPFAPRCTKDIIEEHLFAYRRDLFTRVDLVFMDTTSLYFEGAGGQTLGRHGFSKDRRPDLRQMILAVLIDGDGHPVCSEMWPGNTADVTTLIPVIDRWRSRFAIRRVCIVADRGEREQHPRGRAREKDRQNIADGFLPLLVGAVRASRRLHGSSSPTKADAREMLRVRGLKPPQFAQAMALP
jgi:hypothetical protein